MEREIIFCTCCHSLIEAGDTVYLEELPMGGGWAYICKGCITPLTLDQVLIDEFWEENPEYFEDDYEVYLLDKEENNE